MTEIHPEPASNPSDPPTPAPAAGPPAPRPPALRAVAAVVIAAAVMQSGGLALKMPTQLTANDISRYCTVWALLERGTYAIDECPWQVETQDKVKKPDPWSKEVPAPKHYYSSKPPLLGTVMAGIIYPFRKAIGIPLDRVVDQERVERNVPTADPDHPGEVKVSKETPKPVPWPVSVLYLKPVMILFNVVPFAFFLIFFARFLDRHAPGDWAWVFSIVAASFGTLLFVFNSTLNNHTIAAYSAFFALYLLVRICEEPAERSGAGRYAWAGFFGAFAACNELPAALFGVGLFALLVVRSPGKTFGAFVPAALLPVIAFLATQYIALGQLKPVYEEFGTESYNYEGSYWQTPLEFDWFNLHPEPIGTYLFHMTFGHHGVFSLTPIFLFAVYGMVRDLFTKGRATRGLSALSLVLTVALIAFYAWNPKARNYGGSTAGLRWLFWLIPFWLMALPMGLAGADRRKSVRGLAIAALGLSTLTVGYASRNPWSHPWILDLLEHLDLYRLVR